MKPKITKNPNGPLTTTPISLLSTTKIEMGLNKMGSHVETSPPFLLTTTILKWAGVIKNLIIIRNSFIFEFHGPLDNMLREWIHGCMGLSALESPIFAN